MRAPRPWHLGHLGHFPTRRGPKQPISTIRPDPLHSRQGPASKSGTPWGLRSTRRLARCSASSSALSTSCPYTDRASDDHPFLTRLGWCRGGTPVAARVYTTATKSRTLKELSRLHANHAFPCAKRLPDYLATPVHRRSIVARDLLEGNFNRRFVCRGIGHRTQLNALRAKVQPHHMIETVVAVAQVHADTDEDGLLRDGQLPVGAVDEQSRASYRTSGKDATSCVGLDSEGTDLICPRPRLTHPDANVAATFSRDAAARLDRAEELEEVQVAERDPKLVRFNAR